MIKKTLKFTLSALLLSAAGSAFAAGPVTLSDGTEVSWKDFADVINGTTKPTAATVSETAKNEALQAYNDALDEQTSAAATVKELQDNLNALTKQLAVANDTLTARIQTRDGIMPQTVTKNLKYADAGWFKTQQTAFNAFKDIYDAEAAGGEVWYYVPTSGRSRTLYLSFVNPGSAIPATGATYTKATADEFYENVIKASAVTFTSVKVFLGFEENSTTAYNYTVGSNGLYSVPNYSSTTAKADLLNIVESGFITLGEQSTGATESVPTAAYTWANNRVQAQQAIVDGLKGQITKAQEDLEEPTATLNDANEAVATKKAAYDKAVEDYDAAVEKAAADALLNYQDVTLNANVDATTAITASDYKGTIDGNNKVINVASGNLFKKFSGQLSNAAINGTFASSYATATFDNVAVNAGTAFRYYDGHGTLYATAISSLGQLGFVARESFGVDFANSKLAAKSETTTVYDITVYGAATSQSYVTKNGTTLTGKGGATVTIGDNVFVKSATSDLTGINNVYYADGGVNVCDNVLIKDGVNFYCPEDITATALTYERSFSEGMNTVCLPFTLSHNENITAICEYDRETTEKFWFTYVAGDIEANTPALLFAAAGFENIVLSDVKVAKTDNQVVGPAGNDQANSRSFGTLKKVNAGEFSGEFDSNKVYGLHGDKFQLAGTSASFNPFRMVISSLNAPAAAMPNAPRRIAIADENGVDITDLIIGDNYEVNGVEDIVSDAPEFGISGGQGEIVITSDVDYGKVVVYTVDGKAVAAANVVAGTTAVNVEKGLYIVMGKKVMVK